MIEVRGLTKRFGRRTAVAELSFDVRPGVVTGFLGPNGSGKSTTMRCMIGLDRPDAGTTSFDGRAYGEFTRPLTEVGALFDAGYVHPARSARNHLRWLVASNGLDRRRVDETLEMVGLAQVANRTLRTFSLGMRQRLGLASVMLGDPHTVMLDEPANGLDPEGIRWIRDVLIALAKQGRSVLVSSHQLSEIALMADDLVVIGQGRLIEQAPVSAFVERYADRWVRIVGPRLDALLDALRAGGAEVTSTEATAADVRGVTAADVGERAAAMAVVLHELTPRTGSLEDAYMSATQGTEEYVTTAPFVGGPASVPHGSSPSTSQTSAAEPSRPGHGFPPPPPPGFGTGQPGDLGGGR